MRGRCLSNPSLASGRWLSVRVPTSRRQQWTTTTKAASGQRYFIRTFHGSPVQQPEARDTPKLATKDGQQPGKQTTGVTNSGPLESKSNPKTTKPNRLRKWSWRFLAVFGGLCVGGYVVDKYAMGGFSLRTTAAYAAILRIGLDYKLHFGPDSLISRIDDHELHRRNAERLLNTLKYNGGLYVKAAQALAMQGAVLPAEYQLLFAESFDDAKSAPWEEVEAVIREEFGGRTVAEVFGHVQQGSRSDDNTSVPSSFDFNKDPIATASIAQVHFARLADGQPVAVKVQKRDVAEAFMWDLWAVEKLAEYSEQVTGLPLTDTARFIADRIMEEVDFTREAANTTRMGELVASDTDLRGRAYVPRVFHELSSKRVLTTEWIDGVSLWDKESMKRSLIDQETTSSADPQKSLQRGVEQVMQSLLEFFNKQVFEWGFVHCDPHPGNILLRRRPDGKAGSQIVLLDFGLCVNLSDKTRRQYTRFWQGMVTHDDAMVQQVASEWGLESADAWAEAMLPKPKKDAIVETIEASSQTGVAAGGNQGKEPKAAETPEERQQRMIEDSKGFIGKTGDFPAELFFLDRTMNILLGNNRFLGAPVNRIQLIALGALRASSKPESRGLDNNGAVFGLRSIRQVVSTRISLFRLQCAHYWDALLLHWGWDLAFEGELKSADEKQLAESKDVVAEMFGVTVD